MPWRAARGTPHSGGRCPYLMSIENELNSPAHWRKRAEDTRRLASQLVDPVAKQTAMEIAQAYEQLAIMAEAGALAHRLT